MHTIRLRDPWQCELRAGTCCFRRRFQKPTNLGEGEYVVLQIAGCVATGEVRLNDRLIGRFTNQSESSWRIREYLQPSNVLEIEICGDFELTAEHRQVPGLLLREVQLLILEPAELPPL